MNENNDQVPNAPPLPSDETAEHNKRKNWDPVDTAEVTTANTTNNTSVRNVQNKNTSQNAKNFVGLSNQGATCYLNSLIQNLYNTPEIREMVYKWKYNPEVDPSAELCIPLQLQKLFARLQLSKERAVTTKHLTASFGWNRNQAFVQHDVQELCRVLFDALDMALSQTVKKEDKDENMTEEEKKKAKNPISSLYTGIMIDYITAKNEKSADNKPIGRMREDEFQDIQLVIRDTNSVEEALENFVKPETMEGSEQWFCEELNKKVDAIKGLKFKTLPYLLMLHLKRFDYDPETWNRIKLGNKVTFPFELDLSRFVEDGEYKYELFSVLVHSGNANGGHYYACIKRFDDGKWYNFNDQQVTEISEDDVKVMYGGDDSEAAKSRYKNIGASTNAYMLVYRRILATNLNHVSEDLIPSELRQEIENANEELRKGQENLERMQQMITVKCYFLNSSAIISVNKKQTVTEVTKYLLDHFKKQIRELESVRYEDCRLRDYHQFKDEPGRTFSGREDMTLEELHFTPFKAIYLEFKRPDEEFAPVIETFNIYLFDYKPESNTCDWDSVKVDTTMTLRQFKEIVSQKFGDRFPPEHTGVLKQTARAEVIEYNQENMLDQELERDLGFRENDMVYIEYLQNPFTDESKVKQMIIDQAYQITVYYNAPGSQEYKYSAILDVREPLSTLRDKIAEQLQLPREGFRLCEKRFMNPIRDEDRKIGDVQDVGEGAQIYVELGNMLKSGEHLLRVFLHWPQGKEESEGTEKVDETMAYLPVQGPQTEKEATTTESTASVAPVSASPNYNTLKILYSKQKEFIELGKVVVSENESLADFRKKLKDTFFSNNCNVLPKELVDTPIELMRVRQKIGVLLSHILILDDETMKTNLKDLNGKQVAIQILKQPEMLKEGDNVIYVERWYPSTWKFGPRHELVVSREKIHTSSDLKKLIFSQLDLFENDMIPEKDMGLAPAPFGLDFWAEKESPQIALLNYDSESQNVFAPPFQIREGYVYIAKDKREPEKIPLDKLRQLINSNNEEQGLTITVLNKEKEKELKEREKQQKEEALKQQQKVESNDDIEMIDERVSKKQKTANDA
jgi:ubiquitin C-terminal hydrolase